ncbi:MoxR family ATPase [Oscillatoria sp. CS-180]|uniref:AAA family ATPase n=1 Tax=Oscillatoria sp. CS-180 TaxID=3021720 RepID=UPI00232AADEA|nr:MoxR family ATPase [Oscillatoria sp. CS-180]MDB9529067.1 MoxR family ATPase [Oscillatoria sp. CS-180]
MAEVLNLPEYTGKVQPQDGEQDPETGQLLTPYLPSSELVEAVNLAIFLERPLLLKGEPGCGKTQLARAVAYELQLPFETWYIKSTSRARDGLYTYDAVGRLRDAQLAANQMLSEAELNRIKDPAEYIDWGPLGQAFLNPQRTVVLIDEIDKADIDFPNDLLLELDERQFKIDETGRKVRANIAPIVFITSNDEKDLPDAFLRRCLFHYVDFPNQDRLVQIIHSLFPQQRYPSATDTVVAKSVDRFWQLRQNQQTERTFASKRVSTSELVDWVKVLLRQSEPDILAQLSASLPYPEVLLKSQAAYQRYRQSGL